MYREPLRSTRTCTLFPCWTLCRFSGAWSGVVLAVGCVSAVLSMLAGMVELTRVPEGAALRDTWWHMGLMLTATSLFATRLLLRLDQLKPLPPDAVSLLPDAGGFLALAAGGWFGGRLVYGHGIGRS